jgi:hypothetical protein
LFPERCAAFVGHQRWLLSVQDFSSEETNPTVTASLYPISVDCSTASNSFCKADFQCYKNDGTCTNADCSSYLDSAEDCNLIQGCIFDESELTCRSFASCSDLGDEYLCSLGIGDSTCFWEASEESNSEVASSGLCRELACSDYQDQEECNNSTVLDCDWWNIECNPSTRRTLAEKKERALEETQYSCTFNDRKNLQCFIVDGDSDNYFVLQKIEDSAHSVIFAFSAVFISVLFILL